MNKIIILIIALLFLSIAIPRILFPDLDHGDEWADADLLSAADNFCKFGFINSRFLPTYPVQLEFKENPPYTTYPGLSLVWAGWQRILFRTDSLTVFRALALFFSFLNVLFWYLFIKKFSRSYLMGFLCAIFFLFNPYFIYGFDSLGQISYADFLRTSILLAFLFMLDCQGKKRKLLFISLWILLFIESLFTIEYMVYVNLFFILFKVFFLRRKPELSYRHIIILVLATFAGLFLHFLQNVWYFGSLSAALLDSKQAAFASMTVRKDSFSQLSPWIWWNLVIVRNFSFIFLTNLLLVLFLAFFSALIYIYLSSDSKEKIRLMSKLCLILVICGISWYALFPAHTLAHTYVLFLVRHIVPVASVVFALFVYIAWCFIKKQNPRNFLGKALLLAITVGIAFVGVLQTSLPVTKDKIRQAKDFLIYKQSLQQLKDKSNQKDKVGVNYYRHPFMGYYTKRRFIRIYDKPGLEAMPQLPAYFIFFPYNTQQGQELYNYLLEKYNLMFQSNSQRFLAVFFELKRN